MGKNKIFMHVQPWLARGQACNHSGATPIFCHAPLISKRGGCEICHNFSYNEKGHFIPSSLPPQFGQWGSDFPSFFPPFLSASHDQPHPVEKCGDRFPGKGIPPVLSLDWNTPQPAEIWVWSVEEIFQCIALLMLWCGMLNHYTLSIRNWNLFLSLAWLEITDRPVSVTSKFFLSCIPSLTLWKRFPSCKWTLEPRHWHKPVIYISWLNIFTSEALCIL